MFYYVIPLALLVSLLVAIFISFIKLRQYIKKTYSLLTYRRIRQSIFIMASLYYVNISVVASIVFFSIASIYYVLERIADASYAKEYKAMQCELDDLKQQGKYNTYRAKYLRAGMEIIEKQMPKKS